MARKTISKKTRQLVYNKCNGHCAYCGCDLEYKDMQVDHVESVWRNWCNSFRGEHLTEDELNSIDNYMPTCRQCNFYKSTWTLEQFRDNLTTMLYRNLENNFNYKLLKKYGLITENIKPVVFYFERMNENGN